MKLSLTAGLALLALLASCSVDVQRPSQAGDRRYELILVDGDGGRVHYLLDTQTGALHERAGQKWREIVAAVGE